MIEIRYANGATQMVDTLEEALDAITMQYPDAVFYDQHGFELHFADADAERSLHDEDACILAWRCEEESVNDDGAKAIASLRYTA